MLQGDTVRLKCHFRTLNGTQCPVKETQLTIYKQEDNSVLQSITNDFINMDSLGVFYYDYVASESFIYEFKATYKNRPIVVREKVDVKFI